MNVCQSCGAPLAPNVKFCTNCGAPVAPQPGSQQVPGAQPGMQPGAQPGAFAAGNTQMPDPYSEASVRPVVLPAEEFEGQFDTSYGGRVSQQPTPEAGMTMQFIPPMDPYQAPGPTPVYVQPKKSLAVPILVGIGMILIVGIILTVVLIGLSSKRIEDAPSPNGPTIIESVVPEKKEPEPVPAPAVTPKKEQEKPKDDTTQQEANAYSELSSYYSGVQGRSDEMSSLVKTFNNYASMSVAERSSELGKVQALINSIQGDRTALLAKKMPPNYVKNQQEIAHLYELVASRGYVLEEAYKRAVTSGDDKKNSDFILEPFKTAYAEGQSRSRYIVEYDRLYPQAQPQAPAQTP